MRSLKIAMRVLEITLAGCLAVASFAAEHDQTEATRLEVSGPAQRLVVFEAFLRPT